MFRAAIPLISTAKEAILQFRSLYVYPHRLKMQTIIRLCPPIWDPSPSPSYSFSSHCLPCFTITVLSSPFPFLLQLHCFCHISRAQKVGEWVGSNLFLVTSSVTPDTRDPTSHNLSVPALPHDGVMYEPCRMKDTLYYKELRSQTSLYCATVYRYFKSLSSPNLAI